MRQRFFNKKVESLTIDQIIEITSAKKFSDFDSTKKISDVATLGSANKDQLSFLHSASYFEKMLNSQAGVCFLEESYAKKAEGRSEILFLVHENPYFAYAQIASYFYEEKREDFSGNLVHETAQIGEGTIIAPNAFIGENVVIGKNCYVAPSASIMSGCIIGDNTIVNSGATISFAEIGADCIVYSGARIGQDGFGFAHDKGTNHKVIQLGMVKIGNKVEIGANSCVDRGTLENTIINDDVKIDNMVQVGHNVEIGNGTVIAGKTAIAGSVKIGRFVQIGGGGSIAGHLSIADGSRIAGMSGVTRSTSPRESVAGIPAIPIRQWHRIQATLIKMTQKS